MKTSARPHIQPVLARSLSCGSLCAPIATHCNDLKAQVGAQRIEARINLEVLQLEVVRGAGSAERLKRGFFLAHRRQQNGELGGRDVLFGSLQTPADSDVKELLDLFFLLRRYGQSGLSRQSRNSP